jgi:hypothetical protein
MIGSVIPKLGDNISVTLLEPIKDTLWKADCNLLPQDWSVRLRTKNLNRVVVQKERRREIG